MTIDTSPSAADGRATPVDDPYALASEQFEQALGDEAARLRALLEHESSQREHLQALLEASKQRERRVQRALDVLTGETQPHGGSRKAKRTAHGENMRQTGRANVERVLAALIEVDEPVGVSGLERSTGLAQSTVQRALNELRAQDRARATGKNGTAVLYAPMPDAQSHDVETTSSRAQRDERERKIVEYGREHDEFRAGELVDLLGFPGGGSGLGPTMRGLTNRGVIEVVRMDESPGHRTPVAIYRLSESARDGA